MSKSDPKPTPHKHSRGFGVVGKFTNPKRPADKKAKSEGEKK